MCDKMEIYAYIFKIGEKYPLLRLQMRVLRKCLIVTNIFPTHKQYVRIKLVQNETNRWSIFLVKTKYC